MDLLYLLLWRRFTSKYYAKILQILTEKFIPGPPFIVSFEIFDLKLVKYFVDKS